MAGSLGPLSSEVMELSGEVITSYGEGRWHQASKVTNHCRLDVKGEKELKRHQAC